MTLAFKLLDWAICRTLVPYGMIDVRIQRFLRSSYVFGTHRDRPENTRSLRGIVRVKQAATSLVVVSTILSCRYIVSAIAAASLLIL